MVVLLLCQDKTTQLLGGGFRNSPIVAQNYMMPLIMLLWSPTVDQVPSANFRPEYIVLVGRNYHFLGR